MSSYLTLYFLAYAYLFNLALFRNRIAIYSFLYQEGVMACQKDVKLEKHHILNMVRYIIRLAHVVHLLTLSTLPCDFTLS